MLSFLTMTYLASIQYLTVFNTLCFAANQLSKVSIQTYKICETKRNCQEQVKTACIVHSYHISDAINFTTNDIFIPLLISLSPGFTVLIILMHENLLYNELRTSGCASVSSLLVTLVLSSLILNQF